MADPSLPAALDRLERALARVEQVAAGRDDDSAAHATLERRHDLLRRRVQETIERLDALIAAPPPEETR